MASWPPLILNVQRSHLVSGLLLGPFDDVSVGASVGLFFLLTLIMCSLVKCCNSFCLSPHLKPHFLQVSNFSFSAGFGVGPLLGGLSGGGWWALAGKGGALMFLTTGGTTCFALLLVWATTAWDDAVGKLTLRAVPGISAGGWDWDFLLWMSKAALALACSCPKLRLLGFALVASWNQMMLNRTS